MGSAACLGSNRGSVSLQTIGLTQIRGQFRFKPLVWLKSGAGFASNHWFDPNQGSVSLQTIGLAQIGGRFRSKPLVWLKSGAGFAPNHWFGSNRGSVSLQTIGLTQIRGRFRSKPWGERSTTRLQPSRATARTRSYIDELQDKIPFVVHLPKRIVSHLKHIAVHVFEVAAVSSPKYLLSWLHDGCSQTAGFPHHLVHLFF